MEGIKWIRGSLEVMLSKLVPAVSGVGSRQVVVVVYVLVLDNARELGLAKFFVLQQVHPLQI